MSIRTVGIDLGKTVFHLIGMDESGKIVLRKRMSRSQIVCRRFSKKQKWVMMFLVDE